MLQGSWESVAANTYNDLLDLKAFGSSNPSQNEVFTEVNTTGSCSGALALRPEPQGVAQNPPKSHQNQQKPGITARFAIETLNPKPQPWEVCRSSRSRASAVLGAARRCQLSGSGAQGSMGLGFRVSGRGKGGGGGRGACQKKCPPRLSASREILCENIGATQVAQWHGSGLGAEFDHSPMAPPIVHPSNGVNDCRTCSGSRHPRKRVGAA